MPEIKKISIEIGDGGERYVTVEAVLARGEQLEPEDVPRLLDMIEAVNGSETVEDEPEAEPEKPKRQRRRKKAEEPDDDDIKARLGGIVLAVDDMDGAIAHLRDAGDPHPAVQPGAVFAAIKSGTHGMPLGLIQYNAIPQKDGDSN